MTPWAECLFTVPPKNANLKKRQSEGRPASCLECLKGGRQQQYTHAESGGLIRKVIFAVGGKIYLEDACVLNWIRKLRERKHKQKGINISLEL